MQGKERAKILFCGLIMLALGLWASTDDIQLEFAGVAVAPDTTARSLPKHVNDVGKPGYQANAYVLDQ